MRTFLGIFFFVFCIQTASVWGQLYRFELQPMAKAPADCPIVSGNPKIGDKHWDEYGAAEEGLPPMAYNEQVDLENPYWVAAPNPLGYYLKDNYYVFEVPVYPRCQVHHYLSIKAKAKKRCLSQGFDCVIYSKVYAGPSLSLYEQESQQEVLSLKLLAASASPQNGFWTYAGHWAKPKKMQMYVKLPANGVWQQLRIQTEDLAQALYLWPQPEATQTRSQGFSVALEEVKNRNEEAQTAALKYTELDSKYMNLRGQFMYLKDSSSHEIGRLRYELNQLKTGQKIEPWPPMPPAPPPYPREELLLGVYAFRTSNFSEAKPNSAASTAAYLAKGQAQFDDKYAPCFFYLRVEIDARGALTLTGQYPPKAAALVAEIEAYLRTTTWTSAQLEYYGRNVVPSYFYLWVSVD